MKVLGSIDQLTQFLRLGKKMKDSIPIGFLGGLVGTLAMDLSNIIFKKTGLSEKTYAQYAGSVLLSPFRLIFRENYLLGQILHLITGSILGIPMFNIMKKTGKDNYLFKGAVYGIFSWETLYSLRQRLGLVRSKTYTTRTHITTIIDTLVYGFVSTSAMVFLSDPTIFPQAINQQIETPAENHISKQQNIPKGDLTQTMENEMLIG